MRIATLLLLVLMLAPVCGWAAEVADCEHSGTKSVPSPDGRWIATVQEDVCATGTGTAAGVDVDLTLSGDSTHRRRVFSMRVPRTRDEWPRVLWKSPTVMEIWVPNLAEIGMQVPELEGVRIDLKYCGDNPEERAQRDAYRIALEQWMKDTTAWVEQRKRDPDFKAPRPRRPEEPALSATTCAHVGQ